MEFVCMVTVCDAVVVHGTVSLKSLVWCTYYWLHPPNQTRHCEMSSASNVLASPTPPLFTHREPGNYNRRSHRCNGTVSPGMRHSCTPNRRGMWSHRCGCNRLCTLAPFRSRPSPCSNLVGHRRCATDQTAAGSLLIRLPGSQSSRPRDSERTPHCWCSSGRYGCPRSWRCVVIVFVGNAPITNGEVRAYVD